MHLTIELPDDIAAALRSRWGDAIPRAVLEAIAAEGYRCGELTHGQVMRLLEFRHRTEVDAFLKQAGAYLDYQAEDLEQDLKTLADLRGR